MRLPTDPRLPQDDDVKRLRVRLYDLFRETSQQVNDTSEGRIAAATNAATAAPTSGMYQQGDFVRNKTPTELGVAGSKYVIFGWLNVASGTPGTFVQMRYLTGN